MATLRTILHYILWIVFGCAIALLLSGLIVYRFNISAYARYLNTRNISEVSWTDIPTIIHLFVPTQAQNTNDIQNTNTGDSTTWDAELDPDFEWFFSDFSEQDTSTAIVTGEAFGFVTEGSIWQQWSGDIQTGQTMTEEQQAVFLESLKKREARLQQQAQSESNQ